SPVSGRGRRVADRCRRARATAGHHRWDGPRRPESLVRPGGPGAATKSPALLSYVRYAHIHVKSTTKRLRKPMRKTMCTQSHAAHAKKPESLRRPITATARERPTVASDPLSR